MVISACPYNVDQFNIIWNDLGQLKKNESIKLQQDSIGYTHPIRTQSLLLFKRLFAIFHKPGKEEKESVRNFLIDLIKKNEEHIISSQQLCTLRLLSHRFNLKSNIEGYIAIKKIVYKVFLIDSDSNPCSAINRYQLDINFSSQSNAIIERLFQQENSKDITFLCKNNQTVKAHHIALEDLHSFFNPTHLAYNEQKQIDVSSYNASTIRLFLELVYGIQKPHVTSLADLLDLFELTDMFNMKQPQQQCKKLLLKFFSQNPNHIIDAWLYKNENPNLQLFLTEAFMYRDLKSYCLLISEEKQRQFINYFREKPEDPIFLTNLGFCYETGIGEVADCSMANQLYSKAAQLGSNIASLYVILSYCSEEEVEQNKDKAFQLTLHALEKNNPFAKLMLAMFFKEGVIVKEDLELARRYLKDISEIYPLAKHLLADSYYSNNPKTQNLNLAFTLCNELIDIGYLNIRDDLAIMLRDDFPSEENFSRMHKLLQEGRADKCAACIYTLAGCYENGQGVAVNLEQAISYYKEALSLGNKDALSSLERLNVIIN